MRYIVEYVILISCFINTVICYIMVRVTDHPKVYLAVGTINAIVGIILILLIEIVRYENRE